MGYGSVKNASGTFVKADTASVTEAAAGAAKNMPERSLQCEATEYV
jgi:hypothetical protein